MKYTDSKIFKIFEILLLFAGLPVLYYLGLVPFHQMISLLAMFIFFLIILLSNRDFDRKIFGLNGFKNWRPLIIRFFIIAILLVLGVRVFSPDSFFLMPREKPFLWIIIMLFYPIWSVYPQELIYRTWFFHRYKSILSGERIMIVLNAALFSFTHIVFRNYIAIILTFLGGIMFACTYRKSNSLLVVFIEHMLYGNLVFTIGLGQYFYLPMSH